GAFEQALCDFGEAPHALSCSNGTDALVLLMMAWDVGPGDAVFCPAFTFAATAEVVALAGATPVFIDIRPDTWTMDPDHLRAAVEAIEREGVLKPRAVIPGGRSAWAQFTVEHDDRDALAAHLKAEGVPTAVYYPIPLHRQPAYRQHPVGPGGLAVTEAKAERVVSLPMSAYLDEAVQDRVIAAVASFD